MLSLTSEAAGPLGFEPHVLFDGPVDTDPAEMAVELLAVLQEALTNAAGHARARRVDVEVAADREVVLCVVDEGQGLPDERRSGRRGLSNMAVRALRLGGALHATPDDGSGTVIEWRVPAAPAR